MYKHAVRILSMLGLTFNVRIYWKFISERARWSRANLLLFRPNPADDVTTTKKPINKETSYMHAYVAHCSQYNKTK